MSKNKDLQCRKIIHSDPNMMIPWFLMASYLYYQKEISIISDELFDELCSHMVEKWDTLDHPNKVYITLDDLRAGSGFAIAEATYPHRVRSSALSLAATL